jgi:hypothetical protein
MSIGTLYAALSAAAYLLGGKDALAVMVFIYFAYAIVSGNKS